LDDEYGTIAHIEGIAEALPRTTLLKLETCGHSPHRDQPLALIEATVHFVDAHLARSLVTPDRLTARTN
jgi:pimeloyl-ACP methyl ester carboxylesterase